MFYDVDHDGYAYVTRGKAKTALQDTAGALTDYTTAITLNPKNTEAYTGRGEVKAEMADYTGALIDLDKAIELFIGNSYAYEARGKVESKLGDRKGAIADFKKQLEFDPKNKEAQLRLARELTADRQYSETVLFLNKVITPATKNGKFYIERGIAMGYLGDFKGSNDEFVKAMTIDSTVKSIAYSETAHNDIRQGKLDEAAKLIDKAILKDQNNDGAYFYRADLKMRQKNYLGAEYDYISVLLINPDNIQTYAYRGLSEAYVGDTAAMRADFDKAIKLSPKSSNNFVLRAKSKIVLNDYDGAMKDFGRAIELDPESGEAWLSRGVAKLDKGDQSGCDDLKKAVGFGSTEAADVVKVRCR